MLNLQDLIPIDQDASHQNLDVIRARLVHECVERLPGTFVEVGECSVQVSLVIKDFVSVSSAFQCKTLDASAKAMEETDSRLPVSAGCPSSF